MRDNVPKGTCFLFDLKAEDVGGDNFLKQPEKHDGYAQCSAEMRIEMETKHNLLIVEDEKAISNLIATTLRHRDTIMKKLPTGAQAMLAVTSPQPGGHPSGLGLPDMDGLDIIRKKLVLRPHIIV